MIKEDYVSFEVAKLLKDKGFNGPCRSHYMIDTGLQRWTQNYGWNTSPLIVLCPTLQMAMKWLREVHNIHIGINPISGKGYNATIYDVADFDDYGIISDTESFFHVEQACEAAIKYCLENLI